MPAKNIRTNELPVILQNYWGRVNKNLSLMAIILLFIGFIMPSSLFAENYVAPVEPVIEQARQLQLGSQPAWLNLLHYKSTLLGARKSQVDDADFFLAEEGAIHAQAELEADLRGFFSVKSSAHPRCLFPARFHWLDKQLNLSSQLPVIECDQYNSWKDKFKAEQVTLLFPSMYLDNPASMFGHTFIRFDRADKNHLLSYTLSYAASYDESDHLLVYSWKGITGGYPGKFYLRAYFETLQEYSDIEQRDIWEYRLNLKPAEIEQLIRHLWEVQGMHFDYFFFRENCSFRLLALLDVAREKLNMSMDAHPLYALPVDTVRDVKRAGLIDDRHYRPSTHNKIKQMVAQVGEASSTAAILLADATVPLAIEKTLASFSVIEQAKVLQLADELLNQHKKMSKEESTRQMDVLSARSRLQIAQEDITFNFNALPPELSHQSARWNVSLGEREQKAFYQIGIRPVFHDLLDVTQGFVKGSSISVLETQLRWYQQENKVTLENLTLFSLQSLVAVKPWVTPVSKKISFEIKKRDITINKQITEFETQLSFGYTAEIKNTLVYAMAKGQLAYATELKNNHALSIGADIGSLRTFDTGLMSGQVEISYQLLESISGEESDANRLTLGMQFNISENHALRIEYEKLGYDQFEIEQGIVSYYQYF